MHSEEDVKVFMVSFEEDDERMKNEKYERMKNRLFKHQVSSVRSFSIRKKAAAKDAKLKEELEETFLCFSKSMKKRLFEYCVK